jgi:hypothetical protein
MRPALALPALLLVGTFIAALTVVGCGGGGFVPTTDPGPGTDPDPGPTPVMDHSNIVLKDRWGNALKVGDKEPYSPRETCGACHDVDKIANGYHFQQGRTDGAGTMQMRKDFNGDGRTWLLSDGMFGKW